MGIRNGAVRNLGIFVAGGLLGAGIAALLVPYSGKRTRRNLRNLGRKVMHRSEEMGMNLRDSIDNLVDTVSDKLHAGADRRQ
jgi:gas vesicle protein